jgi:hypothetical protein
MALRSKMLTKQTVREEPAQELLSQRRKPDVGQFLLQVDRQTKVSFATYEEAFVASCRGGVPSGGPLFHEEAEPPPHAAVSH